MSVAICPIHGDRPYRKPGYECGFDMGYALCEEILFSEYKDLELATQGGKTLFAILAITFLSITIIIIFFLSMAGPH